MLYLTGNRELAADELGRALALDPEDAFGHFLQGVLRQGEDDRVAAQGAYLRALALDAEHGGALYHLANLRFVAGRFAEAAKGYRQLQIVDSSIAPARLLALIAERRLGVHQAEIATGLEALAAAHPEDMQLRYALARLLAAAEETSLRDPKRA
ncbi:MAG: hypothetical protein WBG92_15700, partial [Thiohalocapsa sp.]